MKRVLKDLRKYLPSILRDSEDSLAIQMEAEEASQSPVFPTLKPEVKKEKSSQNKPTISATYQGREGLAGPELSEAQGKLTKAKQDLALARLTADMKDAKAKAEAEAWARSQEKMKYDFEYRAIKEIVVCLYGQIPWSGTSGIILEKIWLHKVASEEFIKVVIRDLDDDRHAFEGLVEDFFGCRNGDDIMIRALGG